MESELCIVCSKYFNLLILAKISTEYLGIIWLVTDALVHLIAHGIINFSFIVFPLHQYSTAGKTLFYGSLTSVSVETSKSFMIILKFATDFLLKLIFFLGLFVGVPVIGDANHQELVVCYCAAVFTI
jgi:hypothetical protein